MTTGLTVVIVFVILALVGMSVLTFFKWMMEFTAGETKSKITSKIEAKNKMIMDAKDSALKNTIDGYEFKIEELGAAHAKQMDDAQLELKIVHAQRDELQAKLDSELEMSTITLIEDGDPKKE